MGGARAWWGLGVLFVVYTLNYLDRSLIYILFKPIRAELSLNDLQLALLGSTAFVLFYTVLGVPFGRLADRVPRTWMIAAGLVLWSLASAGTGLAGSFAGLFLCRMVVGVGEATLGPAAYSLLADWFPPHRRATAAALFAAGIPLGAGLAMGLGGWLAETVGWRSAFPLLGLPGLLVAAVVLLLPEPRREARSGPAPAPVALGEVLRRSTILRWHVAGYAAFAVAANALTMWVPTLLADRFDRGLAEIGAIVGACAVGGGLVGTLLGGVAADALQRRFPGGRLAFGAGAAVAFALSWVVLLQSSTLEVAVGALVVGMALGLAWLGPASADIQDLVDAPMRGTAIALYYFVVNVVGYGLGAPVIGALKDAWGGDAALLVCPAACLAAAALLAAGAVARSGSSAAAPAGAPCPA